MATRRTLDQTRELLLDTGASMLIESGIDVSLANVSMIDVCRDAGLSTAGSAYKIWPNQDQFRADLLTHLIERTTPDPGTIDRLAAFVHAAPADMSTLSELIRTTAVNPDPWAAGAAGYDVFCALLLAAQHDPNLAARLHANDVAALDSLTELYEAIADAYDLEWVPPYNAAILAVSLSALVEGISARSKVLPELTDTVVMCTAPTTGDATGESLPWTIYGLSARVIVEAFTRPAGDGSRTATSRTSGDARRTRPPMQPDDIADAIPPGEGSLRDADGRSVPEAATPDQPTTTRRRTRQSLAATRELLLDTGVRTLIDAGFDVTVGNLDLATVCINAGLTSTGSAYKIWTSHDAFRVDVLRRLFTKGIDSDDMPTEVVQELTDSGTSLPDLTEIIRVSSAANFEINSGRANTITLALGLAMRHDPVLAADLRSAASDSLADYAAMYDMALAAYGREWTPPFDARMQSLALSALVQGFAIRALATPELVPTKLTRATGFDGTMQPWHLFACVAEAIMMGFTRPASPSRPG